MTRYRLSLIFSLLLWLQWPTFIDAAPYSPQVGELQFPEPKAATPPSLQVGGLPELDAAAPEATAANSQEELPRLNTVASTAAAATSQERDIPDSIVTAPDAMAPNHLQQQPTQLYRGDSRAPHEIRAQGGFLLRDPSMDASSGYSVVLHVKGVPPAGISPENTVYVSTTSDRLVAARFLRGENGYVYKIHGAPRIFSVAGTLKNFYDYPFPVSNQREFVAMGGIPWIQIKAYAFLPGTVDGTIKEDTVFDWEQNPDYDPTYETLAAGEGRPELAGFGEMENHPANREPYWQELQNKMSLKEYGLQFLDEVAEDAVRWTKQAPLIPNAAIARKKAEMAEDVLKVANEAVRQANRARTVAEAKGIETATKEAVKTIISIGKDVVRVLDYHKYLKPVEVSFDSIQKKLPWIRKAAVEVSMAVAKKKLGRILEELEVGMRASASARDKETIQLHVLKGEQLVDKLKGVINEEEDRRKAKAADLAKVSEAVGKDPSLEDADQDVQDLLKRLYVLRMAAPRETGVDALKRERDALNQEVDAFKTGVEELEKQAKKAHKILTKIKEALNNYPREQDDMDKKEKENKNPIIKGTEQLQNQALNNIDEIAKSSDTPEWLKNTLIAVGVTLGSVGLGIAAAMAAGAGTVGRGTVAASEAASSVEIMETQQSFLEAMRALASADSVSLVSQSEIAAVIAEFNPQMALELMQEAAPHVSASAMESALADSPILLARHLMDREEDNAVRRKWAATAMEPPMRLALFAAWKSAVKEIQDQMRI